MLGGYSLAGRRPYGAGVVRHSAQPRQPRRLGANIRYGGKLKRASGFKILGCYIHISAQVRFIVKFLDIGTIDIRLSPFIRLHFSFGKPNTFKIVKVLFIVL